MGFFNKLFASESDSEKIAKNNINWYNITSVSELDEIDNVSATKPVLIFKHSTRCIISKTALKNFENEYNISEDDLHLYYLDLLNYRDISNTIAERYKIQHQSPQVLVIKNGVCVYTTSHENIDAKELETKIS
jgi:bacillithiol system protein YtxJ